MNVPPVVSIVVPVSGGQGYLRETLQSLEGTDYQGIEVIIQHDGASCDSVAVGKEFAGRDPGRFRLFVEPHGGLADALNRGFDRAKGSVMGYLRGGEMLLPGSLVRIASEIAPARGRHVVMGRSVLVVEGMEEVAVERPSEHHGRFEHLAIWKTGLNTVPQSSVFWHRTAWDRAGRFIASLPEGVDYDFICRMGRHFAIHGVDDLWSARVLPAEPAADEPAEAEVLAALVEISRGYWGSWLAPLRWRCEASYWRYRRHPHEYARHHARRGEAAFAEGRPVAAAIEFLRTWFASPAMARGRCRLK
jgi:glycosyltransferase involved in cell wall biosynthesis